MFYTPSRRRFLRNRRRDRSRERERERESDRERDSIGSNDAQSQNIIIAPRTNMFSRFASQS